MAGTLPAHIGRYHIQASLGAGAMGIVYRAYDPILDRQVALKLIALPVATDNEEWRHRFRREVRAAGRLNHPHIVTVYDVQLEHDPPFVVMELLEGGTLKDFLKRHRPSWREAVMLLNPLCQALAFAHRAGIIHRDVKSANVMFAGDEARTLKLVDFGLARWEGGDPLTQTGQMVGTPAYMSPEQAGGDTVDARTDIFSFGIILFEAITGRNPLDRGSSIPTWTAAASFDPIDLAPLDDQTPPQLIEVIRRAVEKDRTQRYHSCEALGRDLVACLESGRLDRAAPSSERASAGNAQAGPDIENPKGLTLPVDVQDILSNMFADYGRIVIRDEFGTGLSGSRVFLVRPIRHDGTPELPAVIKVAPVVLVQQEWQAYEELIRDRLHDVAEIRGGPVLPHDCAWGGLRYELAGGGAFEVESLNHYCRHAGIADVRYVLEKRLAEIMGPVWRHSHSQPDFHVQASYDALLPVNLLIEPASPSGASPCVLKPGACDGLSPSQGDDVRLEGFVVTEVDPDKRSITLNLPVRAARGSGASYRVRLQPVEAIEHYHTGIVIDSIEGRVVATRGDLLREQVQRAFDSSLDLSADTIALPGRGEAPNPLAALPSILRESRDVKVAGIHGDLNLENILIERGGNRNVCLIDFASAREDHVLHDVLRLETEVITRVVPAILASARLPSGILCTFYEQLHRATCHLDRFTAPRLPHPALKKPFAMLVAIRRMARPCLYNPEDWTEYYLGLTLYLLGALKFRNLDEALEAPLPKQVAFWSAATIQHLLKAPPLPEPSVFDRWVRAKSRVWIGAILFVAMAIGLVIRLGSGPPSTAVPSNTDGIALMGTVQGTVKVQRRDGEVITAYTGLPLDKEDVITSSSGAQAHIYCVQTGLFGLNPGRAVVLTCESGASHGLEPIAQSLPAEVSALVIHAAEPVSPSLASLTAMRSDRIPPFADLGRAPLLLAPRRLTDETRPVFRWTAVTGAEAYTLIVEGPADSWSVKLRPDQLRISMGAPFVIPQTVVLEYVYPIEAPALEPKIAYKVALQAHLPNTQPRPESGEALFFELMDDSAIARLQATASQIRSLAVPEDEKVFLLSLLYQEHDLWAAAADQMEVLAYRNPESPPLIRLGNLYLDAGLVRLAEANYQRALDAARVDNDRYTQAAALAGLGQVAYVAQSDAEAVEYLQQAEALYWQLKEDREVDALEGLLREIASHP